MTAETIMRREDFQRCEAFHGHICPGLAIGYRMARAGMAWLAEQRSEDEEIVAIVENDACSADAVQVITGCTFGKGNFIHKDYGKMALTLLSRNTGRGVRILLHSPATRPDDEHMALIRKVVAGEISDEEQERFEHLHFERSRLILETPLEELFTIEETRTQFPSKATIEPSLPCAQCGEPTMKTKLEKTDGQLVCQGCLDENAIEFNR